jgi:hypothetical protein
MSETNQQSAFDEIQKGGIIVVPWLSGMNAGVGYDSISQIVKGNAAAQEADLALEPVVGKPSQNFVAKIRRVENTQELNDTLAISASISGSYGLFSASASSQYVTETSVHQYALYFLINAFVANSEQQVKSFKLNSTARTLPPKEFRNRFGNYFVQGVITGGSLMALLELSTDSRKTNQQISASTEASYSGGFSIGGKFSTDIKNAASQEGVSLNIIFQLTGASAANFDLNTVEGLLEAVRHLPQMVQDSGTTMYAILKPYSLLVEPPEPGELSLDVAALNETKKNLTQAFLQAKFILNSVNYALMHENQFHIVTSELEKVRRDMQAIIDKTRELSQRLAQDPSTPISDELPEIPSLQLIPLQIFGDNKEPIEPPEVLSPLSLLYRVHSAVKDMDELDLDAELKQECSRYITRVQDDLAVNFNNLKQFLQVFIRYTSHLDKPLKPQSRLQIVENLQKEHRKKLSEVRTKIAEEKDLYGDLEKKASKKGKKLDFLDGKLGLNSYVWSEEESADAIQYGVLGLWSYLNEKVSKLSEIVRTMDEQETLSQRAFYSKGAWERTKDKFNEASDKVYVLNGEQLL